MRFRRLLLTVVATGCLGIAGGAFAATPVSDVPPSAAPDVLVTPPEHRRGEDQTYLTYPEWFLVFSPAELARYLQDSPPSGFPYFGHIGQFWQAYGAMNTAMGDTYELNVGYHVMVFVIGASTTVEYALKAGYEAVFGRMFEGAATPEEELGARIAQDYVDFILDTPWYEYDFFGALASLWRDVPLVGPHLARKWERRYMLTTEYLAKGIYGLLIKAATKAAYEAPLPVTAVVIDGVPAPDASLPDLEVLEVLEDGRALVTLPRYDAFKDYAAALAAEGLSFEEIAGNRGVIVLSVVTTADKFTKSHGTDLLGTDLLLRQTILTEPERQRLVLRTQVDQLAGLLRALERSGATLEHVYDY